MAVTRTYTLKPAQAPARLRVDYASLLNEEQLAAVEAPSGPTLVIAGAGSGKTRTLTFRVARLLETGTPLESMLLLTFTNKAAREMVRRVGELVGEWADVQRLLGGTFHHVAHALLRRHARSLGYPERFSLVDREDGRALMGECLATVAARGGPRLPKAEVMVDLVSMATNTRKPLRKVVAQRRPQFEPLTELLEQAARRFQERKQALGLMDFDDLLVNWWRLLAEHPELRATLAERFRCVLVDEYQDTNRLQGDIVDLLAGEHRNLTVVGDDAQSIYSFRGADFANIIEFPARYPACRLFTLTHNYRSTPDILALANRSIAQNRRQFSKQLQAHRPPGVRPCIVPARDADEQAAFVAQRILELRDEGVPLEEMAVLYRAHHHSMELQVELARRNIPFSVRSGVRFFEQAHIKDVLSFLRFVHNPHDELAFKRLVRLYPGVGPAAAEQSWGTLRDALTTGGDLAQALDGVAAKCSPGRKADASVERAVRLLRKLVGHPKPAEMIEEVLEGGYAEHLREEHLAAERRIEDLKQLAEYAGRYPGLEAFLGDVTLLSELSSEEGAAEGEEDEHLILSTVHQAKGLEWRAVFVISLAEGRFPSNSVVGLDEEEEERRLFYVAATRAKDELYLSYPMTASTRDNVRFLLQPSRYLVELPSGDDAPYDRVLLSSG